MAGPGYHVVLNRDDARSLFAAEGEEDQRKVVAGLIRSTLAKDKDRILDLGEDWKKIYQCLSDDGDPEFPLDCCVSGGRKVFEVEDSRAVLIRPDIVPMVAEALGDIKRVEFEQRYLQLDESERQDPKEFVRLWLLMGRIRSLFEFAAEDRDAVLFAVNAA